MYTSFNTVRANVPKNTRLYCAHEYTLSNLKFAVEVDPDNRYLREKMEWAVQRRYSIK